MQLSSGVIGPAPLALTRNRLSSQLRPTGQIPLRRWLHPSSPRPIPDVARTTAEEAQDRSEVTGAAKLFAEALAEEEAEAKRPKRLLARSSVAVDDSPIWTGEESTRDAVLRMLVDSHKPLRGDFRSADVRMKEIIKGIDTTPIIRPSSATSSTTPPTTKAASSPAVIDARPISEAILKERAIPAAQFRPWHAEYVTNERAHTPQILYGKFINSSTTGGGTSLLDRPALPTDPKARKAALEKRRTGAKIGRLEGAREGALDYRLGGGEGYQTKGSSAAGGGVRGGPSGMRAWGNLVEDRIERARANGWFNNVSGRGKPFVYDEDQHNPHLDRSEFFMNRIIKKQGAKPPWIEVLQELDHAHEAFRTTLLASYTRSLVRSLVTSPFHDHNSLARITVEEAGGLRDGRWQEREAAYHAEAIVQLNSLVRKMNNIAPQPVRRGLISLDDELRRMYTVSGLVIVEELAKRRSAGWDKVEGAGGDTRMLSSSASGGEEAQWDVDLGIVRGVKRLLNKTGLFRIHVLGVGAIGTLLASHLRKQLQPPEEYPITLMISRRGLPDFQWPDKHLAKSRSVGPKSARPVTLALESGGSIASSSDFDYEVAGPALDHLAAGTDRMHSFSPSKASIAKQEIARSAIDNSPYIASNDPIQCLIVTLKCHQTVAAVKDNRHRLDPDSVIVLLQNGMGVYDQLCTEVWPDAKHRPNFVFGSTTHGAAITHQRRETATENIGDRTDRKELLHRLVIHHGRGDLKLGVVPDPRGLVDYDSRLFPAFSPARSSLVALPPNPKLPLSALGSTTSNLSRILSILISITPLVPTLLPITLMQNQLLLKVCVNCAINPITALMGVKNGALLDTTTGAGGWARRMVRRIAKECSAVVLAHFRSLAANATSRSVQVAGATPSTPDTMSISMEMQEYFSPSSLERRILTVCADTANNTSSMLSDVRAGKYTEIDYINGYIIDLGKRLGVSTRWNEELRKLVKQRAGLAIGKESERIRWSIGRKRERFERRARRQQSELVAAKRSRRQVSPNGLGSTSPVGDSLSSQLLE